MNIDLYIGLLKDHCKNLDHEEMEGIAEWLEELKALKETTFNYTKMLDDRYKQGRADQKAEDNEFFNFEGAWQLEKDKIRADAIDELVRMVARYYTAQERAGYYSDTNNMIKQRIADFGEQLKEQKK